VKNDHVIPITPQPILDSSIQINFFYCSIRDPIFNIIYRVNYRLKIYLFFQQEMIWFFLNDSKVTFNILSRNNQVTNKLQRLNLLESNFFSKFHQTSSNKNTEVFEWIKEFIYFLNDFWCLHIRSLYFFLPRLILFHSHLVVFQD